MFVEGGGVTVSAFLEANLLDRLHLAIAPVLIGEGRPAIRLTARDRLRDCARPRYRVFRMGGDVLFDYDLATNASAQTETPQRVATGVAHHLTPSVRGTAVVLRGQASLRLKRTSS